ncbi:MAG: tyrosine-type recombinase/integrase [Chthoniobacteraceae bacterium]
MARIYKQAKSKHWTADFVNGKGMRVRKSTHTTERALAMHIAAEWDHAAKAARTGRLVEAQMRRVISELTEQATGEALQFHTCRGWFDEWLAGKQGAIAPRSLVKYRQVTADFLDHLAARADHPLAAISLADVRGFRDAVAKTGVSPVTVNQTVRKVLSAPFEAARRLGFIPVNPCAGIEAIRDTAVAEKDVFTPEQIAALCAASEGDWRGAILAGYYTGLRLGDIIGLRWEAIDLGTGLLKVRTAKTGKTVVIPLAPELAEWFKAQPRAIGKAPVFPSLIGQAGPGRNGLSMQFKRLMETSGIHGRVTRERREHSAGRTRSSLSFHSLRHSFNSALANAGVAQELRQRLTGHASAAMNDRYTHHELSTLRAAVAKLPGLK